MALDFIGVGERRGEVGGGLAVEEGLAVGNPALPIGVIVRAMVEIWDTHLSEQGVTPAKPTLPPVDDSFQYAPLTSEGSSPSLMNRHRMAMLSQSNLPSPAKK